MSKAFLEGYEDQTIQQLIAMKDNHRIDSLVLAVEQALEDKPENLLSEPERVVLAVEGLEREVNNGGYNQFFFNSSGRFTAFIIKALQLIGCPKCAEITADAITVLDLPNQFDPNSLRKVAAGLSEESEDKLTACDARFFDYEENIAERLFAYIEQHQDEIKIPYTA